MKLSLSRKIGATERNRPPTSSLRMKHSTRGCPDTVVPSLRESGELATALPGFPEMTELPERTEPMAEYSCYERPFRSGQ